MVRAQTPARGSAGLAETLAKASSLLPYAVLASAVLSLCVLAPPPNMCRFTDRLFAQCNLRFQRHRVTNSLPLIDTLLCCRLRPSSFAWFNASYFAPGPLAAVSACSKPC